MESLLDQEAVLEAQIETYRAQLSLVKEQVSPGREDSDKLIGDLSQLVALTEENLMELKKQKLLLMLHAADDGREEQKVEPVQQGKKEEDDLDDLVGMKCQAPLKESWGGINHHNAVILLREHTISSGPEDFDVRVLFSQPLYPTMKPCPFFLDGSCKFSEKECKFSHGHVVQFSRLLPYQEADHSLSRVGGKCLARHEEDGLWYSAIISSVGDDEYVVYFPSLSSTAHVGVDAVFPLELSEGSSSEENEMQDVEEGSEESECEVVEWRPSAPHSALGQWEQYTTGIGSKLLAKMGYMPGQGLGKTSQGRVEPVEIIILPTGKSLDVCAELREAKKVRKVDGVEVLKKKRRKKKKEFKGSTPAEEGVHDMFDFINTKVFAKNVPKRKNVQLEKSDSANTSNLNLKLFKVQENMKAINKQKESLKESLQRHQKRKDKQLESKVKEKLAAIESQLEHLHRQEQSIEKNITTKSERKKLSIF